MKALLRKIFHSFPLSWRIRIKREISLLYYNAGYGDTLMIGAVAREIKRKYGPVTVIVNCAKNELLQFNPNVDKTGQRYNGIDLNYHHNAEKNGDRITANIIDTMCRKAGVSHPQHSVDIFLTEKEIAEAQRFMAGFKRPIITIHTTSDAFDNGRKLWPVDYWEKLVAFLSPRTTVLQLGGAAEHPITGAVHRLGNQEIRQSIALIKFANLHVGIVSSLMHGAAAVGTTALILYGGFERATNHGYPHVHPIESEIGCAPCIRADVMVEKCPIDVLCMREIAPEIVYKKVINLLKIEAL